MNEPYWPFKLETVPQPDIVLDGCRFDVAYRLRSGLDLPLKPTYLGNRYYWLPGCYCWFDSGGWGEIYDPYIVYVGKAANVRNRCIEHWCRNRSSWMRAWCSGEWFFPYVAIWLRDDRSEFEATLISLLKPKMNQHRERDSAPY